MVIDMFKFAIWGAGQKGKVALKSVGRKRVSCIVDSNEDKQGKIMDGVLLISYEEYLTNYRNDLLLVTMLDNKDVIERLTKDAVPFVLWEETAGILETSDILLDDIIGEISNSSLKEKIGICGLNLLSILLYDGLSKEGLDIKFLTDSNKNVEDYLRRSGYEFNTGEDCHKIVVSDESWSSVVEKYPNIKIVDIKDMPFLLKDRKYFDLIKFKNIHKNRRCFIVGNGPSLDARDLEKLHKNGEICFGTNMIYKIFPKTCWRPQYYVACDLAVLKLYGEEIKRLQLPCMFIGNGCSEFWEGYNDTKCHKFNDFKCRGMKIPSFSDDIGCCVYVSHTVSYACFQIAMYMGVSEIYLLGIDANYNGYASNHNNHFTDEYYDKCDLQRIPVEQTGQFRAYQMANKYAKQHGIKIYNATRGGELEVFERVDFDALF